ncbi:MAG: AraC family transcriptional regulator [Saprospiraceae bacterium]
MLKPIPFKIQKSENHALLVQIDEATTFYQQLHYHPEFQITAIVKGAGVFYAGNNVSTFEAGEILLIGSNVPHLLKSTPTSTAHQEEGVKGISLFFDEFSFGKQFFEIKEMMAIKSLLQASNRVLKISGALKKTIYQKIISTPTISNEQLVITFLQILALLNQANKTYLNDEQYMLMLNEDEGGRLNEVLDFTFKNFNQEITIEQITKIAHLSRSQFSYFFKLHTGKTYIQFLNELRIENACISLKNANFTIERICYEVGFKNVSNFVRQFKKIKNSTPSKYRKLWVK